MNQRDEYTSESYKSHYSNAFELANKAIVFARYSLKSGHYMSLDEILEEMRKDPRIIEQDIETLEARYRSTERKEEE